jgi:hypothetical protein
MGSKNVRPLPSHARDSIFAIGRDKPKSKCKVTGDKVVEVGVRASGQVGDHLVWPALVSTSVWHYLSHMDAAEEVQVLLVDADGVQVVTGPNAEFGELAAENVLEWAVVVRLGILFDPGVLVPVMCEVAGHRIVS